MATILAIIAGLLLNGLLRTNLAQGRYSLAVTFWLYGIVGGLVIVGLAGWWVFLEIADSNSDPGSLIRSFKTAIVPVSTYAFIVFLGIWRSAGHARLIYMIISRYLSIFFLSTALAAFIVSWLSAGVGAVAYFLLRKTLRKKNVEERGVLAGTLANSSSTSSGSRFENFILHSGVTDITSDTIFFKPNIPALKLSRALSKYGGGLQPPDVVVLVDDTVLGGAREGILITEEAVLINQKSGYAKTIEFAMVTAISSDDNSIFVNNDEVAKLTHAESKHVSYLFSILQEYIDNIKRAAIQDAGDRPLQTTLDEKYLEEICLKYKRPLLYSLADLEQQGTHHSFMNHAPRETPSYSVSSSITPALLTMARFSLSVPVKETIVAISDLGGNARHAFVVTNAAIYSKSEALPDVKRTSLYALQTMTVTDIYEDNYLWGIVLSDGSKMACSRKNVIVKPFGHSLVRDIIEETNNPTERKEPTDRALRFAK